MILSNSLKNYLKLFFKIAVTVFCLWFVSKKIDWNESFIIIRDSDFLWFSIAILLFVASKLVSAIRLNIYFRNIELMLSQQSNIKLYCLGMFYNLFLPGGIGGDAYKVVVLKRKFPSLSAKKITAAVLLDRISGVVGLGVLAIIYYYIIFKGNNFSLLLLFLIPAGFTVYYFIVKKIFPSFIKGFWPTLSLGIAVQLLQVFCVYAILKALDISEHYTVYILIFLLSSVVAILPFTIGGLGARELVFLWGSNTLLHIKNDPTPVSISITFYLVTLLVSLIGLYWLYKDPLKSL